MRTRLQLKTPLDTSTASGEYASMDRPKIGILYSRPNKDSQLEQVRVELTGDRLTVRRHDMVYEDVIANNDIDDERTVTLERGEQGLGFSIQGGLDFKCPIKVYKVLVGSSAHRFGLDERDVILEVNGISLWGKTHEEAGQFIINAGNRVQLRIGKLTLRDIEDQQPIVDQWLLMADIPLKMASVTRYRMGTAILRPNIFQVMSEDGRSKVNLHCDNDTPGQLMEWTTAVNDTIDEFTKAEMERSNATLDRNDQVIVMGWVSEHLPAAANTKVWQRKFLVLRRLRLQLYNVPPESTREWSRPEKSYKLVEMTIKVLKPHSFIEQRANTAVITTGHGTNHIISFETQQNLEKWTRSIHNRTVEAVLYFEKQQFLAHWKGQNVYFLLDIAKGYVICSKENLSRVLWSRPFSALRNSSDDGHSKLRLECTIPNSQLTEMQEIELEDLHVTVCAMECFLAAKVATLDPQFISRTDLIA